ncbi:MAG: DUF1844 domain-containing protein [Candidatus Hermodarchaeota archaeon]|nr:DUF1844 domain-containing protein [Candidatus Hermodarchaeota archaeon]
MPENEENNQDPNEAQPEGTESKAPPQMVDISALPLWQILPLFLNILDRIAWQKMGLVVNPATQEIEQDLTQARAAIDIYEYLFSQLGTHVEEKPRQILEARLTDLKLNFARQA